MSDAQRYASIMRQYALGYHAESGERGIYEATAKELERLKAENERLRAHIQEAADDAKGDFNQMTWQDVRDWHLAALSPQKEQTCSD